MEKNKHKKPDLNDQVHSEFENSVGNDFKAVRDETLKKQETGEDGPLNQLPDEDSVKNEQDTGEDVPKMNTEKS